MVDLLDTDDRLLRVTISRLARWNQSGEKESELDLRGEVESALPGVPRARGGEFGRLVLVSVPSGALGAVQREIRRANDFGSAARLGRLERRRANAYRDVPGL